MIFLFIFPKLNLHNLLVSGGVVVDYDCRSEPGLCSPSATCVQNQDVFVCLCNQGYEGDGRSCRRMYCVKNSRRLNKISL